MDLDTRARSAAQGIHRAVEVMEVSTRTDQPRKVERFDRYRDNKNRNRRIGALAVAAVLVTVIAIVAVGSTRTDQTRPAVSPTIAPAIDWPISPPGSGGFMVDLTTGTATPLPDALAHAGAYYAVSPDHTKVAYSQCCNSPFPLYIANIDGTGITRITPAGYDAHGAQWSPDGSQLLYQQLTPSSRPIQHGDLYTYDVATGRRTRITSLDPTTSTQGWWFLYPSYSPDGRSILFQLRSGTTPEVWDLWSMPVSGGQPALVVRNAGWASYSPDGRSIAYVSPVAPATFDGTKMWIKGLDGGGRRLLVRDSGLVWLRWSPDGTRIAYADDLGISVLDVASGRTTPVSSGGGTAEWFDDHTLIVGPGG